LSLSHAAAISLHSQGFDITQKMLDIDRVRREKNWAQRAETEKANFGPLNEKELKVTLYLEILFFLNLFLCFNAPAA
jgi:hypothetical protein